jgi:hypothetical protein
MTQQQQLKRLIDTYVCQNCDWQAAHVAPGPPPFEIDIPDLLERVSSGEIHPAGTCPACGALVRGLLDDLLVIDAEAGTYYALSASQCLSYTGMAGPRGLAALKWQPLERLPPEPLAQLIKRHLRQLTYRTQGKPGRSSRGGRKSGP